MQQVDAILQAMLAQINLHSLELMTHYPNDLLIHDRAILERAAHRGALIAWMVGDCHTHINLLGIHPEENKCVTYYTNLSSKDHFYVLHVMAGSFTLKEVTREAFAKLDRTPIPYKRIGAADAFWLCRGDLKIGYCKLTREGDFQTRKYNIELSPVSGIDEIDKAALLTWASHAAVEVAHTLFVNYTITWGALLMLAA